MNKTATNYFKNTRITTYFLNIANILLAQIITMLLFYIFKSLMNLLVLNILR